MPTRDQIIKNIEAMEKQGATQGEVQSYLDSLKAKPAVSPSPVPTQKRDGFSLDRAIDVGAKYSNMVFGGGKIGEALAGGDVSLREAAGSALQSASLFVPVGRAIGAGTRAARLIGLRGLSKAAGTIGGSALGGYSFDVATNLQDKTKTAGEVVTPGIGTAISAGIPAVGMAVGAVARGAKEVAKTVAPKLLSYTADIPEQAFDTLIQRRESVTKAIKQSGTAEEALEQTRGAVRQLRTTLSKEWDEGVQQIADEFSQQRLGVAGDLEKKIGTLADDFGVRIPQNIKSASVVEWMDTLKSINELPKLMLSVSPKGAVVREVKKELKDLIVKEFGGDTGSVATLYRNYAAKKTVFDAANQLVQAYSTGKPIQQSTSLGRLKALFNDNKSAYLDAILQLEKETGQDLLSRITALQFQSKLPKTGTVLSSSGGLKSSKGPFDKAIDMLLIPLTSPRAAAWIVNALNKKGASTVAKQFRAPGDVLIDTIESTPGKQGGFVRIGATNPKLGMSIEDVSKSNPLLTEARKYKTAEEFVKAQGTRTGVEVRDKIGTKLQDPYTAEYLPTNSDGTITLYHSTTKEGAEKIKQSGIFGSKTEGGDIYFTTNKKGYGGIGKDKDVVLAFNVDPKKIKFDDVYRGELHLKGNNTDIGGIKPVVIKTKSQLTDIWKQANKVDDLASSIAKAKASGQSLKYKTTINIQDKNDLDYLRRIFSDDTVADIKAGKKTNWRGESYSDIARVNIISETPKTIAQQLEGKVKDVKLKSDTFYHGTSAGNADSIMSSNFKLGSQLPENAFRGGGYGKIQNSISLAETPKEASIFSELTKGGKIIEVKLKPNSKVVSIEGVEDATDLEDYISYLKKEKIDAVYIGGGEKELVIINPKAVTPTRSQLKAEWDKIK